MRNRVVGSTSAITVVALAVAVAMVAVPVGVAGADGVADTSRRAADRALDRALEQLVALPGGPPGVIAVIQRGDDLQVHRAGVGDIATGQAPARQDHMRIASTAKAFSGAVALSLVNQGVLSLNDTIGERLPDLTRRWHRVTLAQLLGHTSGVPDFSASPDFLQAVLASLDQAPPPRQLLAYVEGKRLEFEPGTQYRYSNSDNIIVALMVEAATGRTYEHQLAALVTRPLGLGRTSLPRGVELPEPSIKGYDLDDAGLPVDITELLAAGWAWASGGIVSTPADLNRFIRAYVGGELFGRDVRQAQFQFFPGGGSEPTGPGVNAAGLALFRYQTRCGTVFGHTGNTLGYTQFMAASRDGRRSVTVSINLQRTQNSAGPAAPVFTALRAAEELAVCAALA